MPALRPRISHSGSAVPGFRLLALYLILLGPLLAQPLSSPEVPMADYLAFLARLSPPAEAAARTYLQAFELRCRRPLASDELRRAFAQGSGEPVLMAMVRASHLNDGQALTRLRVQVPCPTGFRP